MEHQKFVVFTLICDNKVCEYGVPIEQVYEINQPLAVTKLPQAPAYMEGIVNLRGQILPVIDLKKRMRVGAVTEEDTRRIIVVKLGEKSCAVLVDDVDEIVSVAPEEISDPPDTANSGQDSWILGIAHCRDRLIVLLDMEKLLGNAAPQEETAVS